MEMRSLVLSSLLLPAALLRAQTLVESALITSAGSAGAAKAGGTVSKSIGAVLGKLQQTVQGKGVAQAAAAPKTIEVDAAAAAERAPQAQTRCAESGDLSAIKTGLTREELLKNFGDPCMKISSAQAKEFVETWWYTPAAREGVIVTLRDGKVSEVSAAPAPKQHTTAVLVLQ